MVKDIQTSDEVHVTTLIPQVFTGNTPTDTPGTGIDGKGYQEVAHFVHFGNSGDTLGASLKVEAELEDSDDDSTYAAVPAAQTLNAVTGTATGCFAVIDAAAEDSCLAYTVYRGSKRYSRVNLNFTGNHAVGIPISMFAVKRGPQYRPVSSN